jgi:hypothetical protein
MAPTPLHVQAPVCAALSGLSAGLCGFGDALLFHSCMLLWHAGEGALLTDATLVFSVHCTAVMSAVFLPLTLYLARAQLRRCAPYGAAQAVTGLAMVPMGTSLLFLSDLTPVKVAAGVLFAAIASLLLVRSVRDEAREEREAEARAAEEASCAATLAAAAAAPALPPLPPLLPLPPPPPPPAVGRAFVPWPEPAEEGGEDAVRVAGSGGGACSARARAALRAVDARCAPALGPRFSPSQTLGVLLCSGTGAGFLNGLLGTGGPPQMIAFALLEASKEGSRGTSACYSALEVPLRVALLALGPPQAALGAHEARAALAAVAAAGIAAFLAGNFLRAFADTRAILRVMLALTLLSGSTLVGALEAPAVAAAYGAAAAALLGVLLALRYRRC